MFISSPGNNLFKYLGDTDILIDYFRSIKKHMKLLKPLFIIIVLIFVSKPVLYSKNVNFTLKDRDRLIKLEVEMKSLKESIDKRFESIDKRFDQMSNQMDKRFDQLHTFLYILTGIFTTLTIAVIGFAYWDRRTIIRKAKEETIYEIEKEGRLTDLIKALRDLSKDQPKLASILKSFHLL